MKTQKRKYLQSFSSQQWGQIACLCFLFITYPNYSQVQQRRIITELDYHLWGTLQIDKMSDKGNWVSFAMNYDESPDTLFIKNTNGNKTYSIAKAREGNFCKEERFACVDDDKILHILNLRNGDIQKYEHIESYYFSGNKKYLITKTGKELQVRNIDGNIIEYIYDVEEYRMNTSRNSLVYIKNEDNISRVVMINLQNNIEKTVLVEDLDGIFTHLVWSEQENNALVCIKENRNNKFNSIFYYSLKDKTTYEFEADKISDFPKNFYLEKGYNSGLTLSLDGEKVFFTLWKVPSNNDTTDSVQIWNTNDAVIYSEKIFNMEAQQKVRVASWIPKKNAFMSITNENTPHCFLNSTKNYALTFNLEESEIQYKQNPNVNYYVVNIESGERVHIVKNQSTDLRKSSLSPQGKYFAYFNDNNWWVYDFIGQTKINLTENTPIQIINEEDSSWKDVYGLAGWGKDDEYLLLYDQYDIWKFSFDGKQPTRITDGREKNISFRIVPLKNEYYSGFTGNIGALVNIYQNVLLKGVRENETGYFLRLPNGNMKTLVFNNSLNNKIIKARSTDSFTFQSQKYDSPPELIYFTSDSNKKRSIFQSNKHHYDYSWGKQEVIRYKNSKSNDLKGILYYPVDYNPTQKYPLVVSIYEKQSYLQHYYFNPSVYNTKGLNISSLTAQGYFVLLPDIEYEIGNPGMSATDCVMAATNEVIRSGLVFPDKIALIGQSFGGYETNFIVTQTNLFTTAISSASVFDLTGWYLSISKNTGIPEIWRSESQQWRMGKSLFEDRESYERNSPLAQVENITAPLLLWTGEEDKQINPNQSIAFYLALRRLQKKGILLVYPSESHSLLFKNNQRDLYYRVKDWLSYFLKNQKIDWIKNGIE